MRFIPIEYVKENDILGRNIYDLDGRILLKSGVVLKGSLIERLKRMNIYSVYISDEYSDEEIQETIPQELRQKCILSIKKSFSKLQNITLADTFSKKQNDYLDDIEKIMEDLMEEIMNNKDAMISIIDIKSLGNYLYEHSVNTAVMSIMLGRKLKLTRVRLKSLCIGALLHDVGKVFLPKEIINKNEKLNEEELEIMNKHTIIGYNYLKEISTLSSTSKVIALQHHENIDGSGYPDNLTDNEISYLAKIVSVVDTYDNLCSDKKEQRAVSPEEALEYIMSMSGIRFDIKIVEAFLKIVQPYPKGTLLRLSNKDIAVVEDTIENYPLRPKVKILKSSNENNIGTILSLTNENSIVIESVCYEI